MKRDTYRSITMAWSSVLSIIGVGLSVSVLALKTIDIDSRAVGLGLMGSIVGAIVVYSIAKLQSALKAPRVFISYTHADKDFAHKLAAALEQAPIHVLLDTRELRVGDKISDRIQELLSQSKYFVYVISRDSEQSKWSQSELEAAIRMNKIVLPAVTDLTPPPQPLKDVVYADFTSSFESGVKQLREAIRERSHNKAMQPSGVAGG